MAETKGDAVAQAYRTINEADPEVAQLVERLKGLYAEVGEDPAVGETAIDQMLSGGPGAVDRLRTTAEAVARLHGLEEK